MFTTSEKITLVETWNQHKAASLQKENISHFDHISKQKKWPVHQLVEAIQEISNIVILTSRHKCPTVQEIYIKLETQIGVFKKGCS